jgi:hypothetical protein
LPEVQKALDGDDRPNWQNRIPLLEMQQGRFHEDRRSEMGKQWSVRPKDDGLNSRFVLKERTGVGISHSGGR